MNSYRRELDVRAIDDLDTISLDKLSQFFNIHFPDIHTGGINNNYFLAKIAANSTDQSGFITAAFFGNQVVGTCTAVRKQILIGEELIQAVEIGDTFTAEDFRKDCNFKKLYPGTKNVDEYLNKSIFGRLVTETLDRAKSSGVLFVYGVPNEQSKLPYLKRLDFQLIDGDRLFRLTCPSLSHPKFRENFFEKFVYKIYLNLTYLMSRFLCRQYQFDELNGFDIEKLSKEMVKMSLSPNEIQILNSEDWINYRFLKNSDKKYRVIQISENLTNEVCGYVFYIEKVSEDGFRLLVHAKDIFLKDELHGKRLELIRCITKNQFDFHNLSVWVDSQLTPVSKRVLRGFISRPKKVDVIGRFLDSSGQKEIEKLSFSNFQYGDSDLG